MRLHCSLSLSFCELVVNSPQALAQMDHRGVLARKQRIHAKTTFNSQFLKAAALDFMGEKYLALLFRKLLQRILKRLDQNNSGVDGLGPGIRRREQVFQLEQLSIFRDRPLRFHQLFWFSLAEPVCNPIARYAEQPSADLLDGL